MSTPRCCPPAYGSGPSENGRSTGPAAGQVQACAAGAAASAASRTRSESIRRMSDRLRCQWRELPTHASGVSQRLFNDSAVQRVTGNSRQPRDARRLPAAAARPPRRARRRAAERLAGVGLHRRPRPRPTTSVISPFGGSANRAASSAAVPAHDLLEALRQLAADGDRPFGQRGGERPRASPAAAAATRTPPRDAASPRARPTAPRAPSRRAAGSRGTGSARPRARSRRAPSRRPTGPGAPSPGRRPRAPRRSSARPGR